MTVDPFLRKRSIVRKATKLLPLNYSYYCHNIIIKQIVETIKGKHQFTYTALTFNDLNNVYKICKEMSNEVSGLRFLLP